MADRPFRRLNDVMALLSRGRFVEKCDEHLVHAVETLQALPEGKGSATLTIQLTINFDSDRLDIKPSVKSKLPEEKGFSSTPFWAVDGGVSVQHPSQFDMFPRDASPRRTAEERAAVGGD